MHARPIKHLHGAPAHQGVGEATPFKTPRRSGQRRGKSHEPAVPSKSSKQIDILEDWIGRKTARRLVRGPAYENPGVPVPQSDLAEPRVQPVEESCARSFAFKAKREIPRYDFRIRERGQNPDRGVGFWLGIRVKKPDRIAGGSARTRMHLYTAASITAEHPHSRAFSGADGVIRASAINYDDLDIVRQSVECGSKAFLFIKSRDDDGKPHDQKMRRVNL